MVIISDDTELRARLAGRRDTVVVATPLELLFALEAGATRIAKIMLAGRFVRDHDLAAFLGEQYPEVGLDRLEVEAN